MLPALWPVKAGCVKIWSPVGDLQLLFHSFPCKWFLKGFLKRLRSHVWLMIPVVGRIKKKGHEILAPRGHGYVLLMSVSIVPTPARSQ